MAREIGAKAGAPIWRRDGAGHGYALKLTAAGLKAIAIDEGSHSSRTIESIAAREKKTERSIRMTLSLAFLSPALVKAAVEGRLSRGFGVKRLMDLPMGWSDQWSALGLKAPAQT